VRTYLYCTKGCGKNEDSSGIHTHRATGGYCDDLTAEELGFSAILATGGVHQGSSGEAKTEAVFLCGMILLKLVDFYVNFFITSLFQA